jgi:hypothetical protein
MIMLLLKLKISYLASKGLFILLKINFSVKVQGYFLNFEKIISL